MIVLLGKARAPMDANAFQEKRAAFSREHLDIGTGDGKNVLKSAAQSPETLFIGLDAAAENMVDSACKAAKKPEKGGRGNVLFVVAAIEAPPAELLGAADEVSVLFPWGSLLAGVARAEHETLANIRTLCRPGAPFTFVTTYSPSFEAAEIEKRGLPPLSLEFLRGEYADALKKEGFFIDTVELLYNDYAAKFESAWAKRLAHGRRREFYRIAGTIGGDSPQTKGETT